MRKFFLACLSLLCIGLAGAIAQTSVFVPATTASVPFTITTATTTKLIDGLTGLRTYITNFNVIAGGSGTMQLIAGTGATCSVSAVSLTGQYSLTGQSGIVLGVGNGTVLVAGPGLNVCAVTTSPVGMPGSIAYGQF